MTMDTKTDEIERWISIRHASYDECLAMPMSVFAVISPHIEILHSIHLRSYELARKPFVVDVLPVGFMETLIAKHRMLPEEDIN